MYFLSHLTAIDNAPKVGVEISDLGLGDAVPGLKEFYGDAATPAEMAKKAEAMEGADFICLRLEGGDQTERTNL